MKTIPAYLMLLIFLVSSNLISCMAQKKVSELTGNDVIDQIREHTGVTWSGATVDVVKTGDASDRVSGIAVCFMATMDVVKEAVSKGCNMIITHEPTFYNHLDETASFEGNRVFEEKLKFIRDHNIIIFRFHDHIHRMIPDGIEAGMISKLGLGEPMEGLSSPVFRISETSVRDYVNDLEVIFNSTSIRYIGDPDMRFNTVGLSVGAPSSLSQIAMLENPAVQVLIAGESREWETVEYIRDAVQQGRQKAMILLGHVNSEEAGMLWCTDWIKSFVTEVPVYFIATGEPFGKR